MKKIIPACLAVFFALRVDSIFAQSESAQPIKIHLLQAGLTLEYTSAPRLSQSISDAEKQVNYAVYPLGITLISPEKQPLIEQKKRAIFSKLKTIDTPESLQILKHLKKLNFVYKQPTDNLLKRIRLNKKHDPLLLKDYTLSISIRPNHIRVITPRRKSTSLVKLLPNASLKDYLTKKIAGDSYDSAWVVQVDQHISQASNIQWENKKHYLAPGAIVYVGLSGLFSEYQALNQDIVELLSQHLEL
ncbi:hypothetical protein CBF23_010540 [Marinomonas agarivorans]|nr:hypothetical protein CBF23_010540 [Marinomonas agarivorans]